MTARFAFRCGEPIERGDAIGPDAISPVWSSKESDSPLLREVGRVAGKNWRAMSFAFFWTFPRCACVR